MPDDGRERRYIREEIASRERLLDQITAERDEVEQEIRDLKRQLQAGAGMTWQERRALMRRRTAEISRKVLASVGILLLADWLRHRPVMAAAAVAVTAATVIATQVIPKPDMPGAGLQFAGPPRDGEILLPDRTPTDEPSFDRTPSPTLIPSDPAFTPTPTATLPMTGSPSPTFTPTPTPPSPPPTSPPPSTPPPSPSPTPTRPPTPPPPPSPSPTPSPTQTPGPDTFLACLELPPLEARLCLLNLDKLGNLLGADPQSAGARAGLRSDSLSSSTSPSFPIASTISSRSTWAYPRWVVTTV